MALPALLALGCGARPGRAAAREAGSASVGVLAWGATGLRVGQVGAALQSLPHDDPGPGEPLPPVPVVGGLWARAGERRLIGWRRDAAGAWAIAARHEFDEPVHALTASADSGHAMAAHGERLSLIDAAGALVRRYEGTDLPRRRRGRARSLLHLAGRRSFVASWPELGELWEISLDPAAEPVFDGLVHDYRMGEGIATPGYLGVRRSVLGTPMADIRFADERVPWVAGRRGDAVDVVHLDVRRPIAEWQLPGATPAAALLRRAADRWTWWLPADDGVQVIETARWQVVDRIEAPGRVRGLQALGDAVWALCGDGATARLSVWRRGRWEPLTLPAGVPRAMHADPGRERLLVATVGPSRLLVLDGDGRAQYEWTLPDEAAPLGTRWLPLAA